MQRKGLLNSLSLTADWTLSLTADWTLVVLQDLAVASQPVRSTTRVVLVFLALSALVIVVISVLSTKTLLRRYARAEQDRVKLFDHLVQAGKLATMGQMAAGVAHEINNPLAVMLSEVGVMEDVLDPAFGQTLDREEFQRRMDSIKQEIHRCRGITQKLLGFSRHPEARIETHDIDALVSEAVELVGKELSLENIEIAFQAGARLPPLETDAEKIRQVFINPLRNAKDAIRKDGRITISTREDRETVGIVFSDTGHGISEENLAKIFQPFFTTKASGKGTGLGLSISQGIVTALGGTIRVESEVGSGTTFEIELPK